ncbi:hypothetical protein [Nannocystis pusilla]|uniref:hypothetical protein n=1 Tax=Nannocystis pusilla TaxID=889268 RepID=UPI003B789644
MMLTNQVFVVCLAVILAYMGLFVALGLYTEALTVIPFWLAYFACMAANKFGWFNVSRIGLCVCCCTAIVFFASMLGEPSACSSSCSRSSASRWSASRRASGRRSCSA